MIDEAVSSKSSLSSSFKLQISNATHSSPYYSDQCFGSVLPYMATTLFIQLQVSRLPFWHGEVWERLCFVLVPSHRSWVCWHQGSEKVADNLSQWGARLCQCWPEVAFCKCQNPHSRRTLCKLCLSNTVIRAICSIASRRWHQGSTRTGAPDRLLALSFLRLPCCSEAVSKDREAASLVNTCVVLDALRHSLDKLSSSRAPSS